MKIFTALFLIFSLVALSGNLMAQEGKKWQVSLGGGLLFLSSEHSTPFGVIGIGRSFIKGIGLELGGTILGGGAIIAGNLILSPFDNQLLTPYATGGVWTTTGGGLGFNVGGGLRIKLSEVYAIRAEYRYWFVGELEWGVNSILGGISLSF